MSVGSKVIFLVLAVGLQSLFNGDSIGCAYAKPTTTLIVQDGYNSNDFYKLVFANLEKILKLESHEIIEIGDQNTAMTDKSEGILIMGAKVDNLDNNNKTSSEYSGPGAFYLGRHNTVQTSNSNMTINTGSWVTYRNNTNNSK